MYDKNTMVTSIFEKKKKKDICKALTGLWWPNVRARLGHSWRSPAGVSQQTAAIRGRGGRWGEAELGFGGATPWWKCWGSLDTMVGALCGWQTWGDWGSWSRKYWQKTIGTEEKSRNTAQAPQTLYTEGTLRDDGVAAQGRGTRACGSRARTGGDWASHLNGAWRGCSRLSSSWGAVTNLGPPGS